MTLSSERVFFRFVYACAYLHANSVYYDTEHNISHLQYECDHESSCKASKQWMHSTP